MYKKFFGLRENPFNVNPDPRFLYLTSGTLEALAQLTYGVQSRKGFVLLTGEVGTGKTTLINYLLDWLPRQKMPTAFIFNPNLNVNHLFDFILNGFGIPVDSAGTSNTLLRLNTWLIERYRSGEIPVLIVDEAQGLSCELLEEIRLLLNLETPAEKLLQIVLVGQPELEDKLKRPELRQLRQRITLRCTTAPLTLEESHGYIAERLRIGGAVGDPIFASDAMDAVHSYSKGIPRVMNLLCEHALIKAYVEQLRLVSARMVEEAAREYLLDDFRPVPALPSFSNQMDSDLAVMYSSFAKELVPPFTADEASLPEPPHNTSPSAPESFVVEEPALTRENSSLATVPLCVEMLASGENLNVSVSLDDLISDSPGLVPKQNEIAPGLDSTSSLSDSAAQLLAESKPNLPVALPIPAFQGVAPGGRNEPFAMTKGKRLSAFENRELTLDTINQLPPNTHRIPIHRLLLSWETWSSRWVNRCLLAVSWAKWSSRSLAALRGFGQLTLPVRVLPGRWMFDFKRDWIAMINAFSLPEMKKSLLRWPRQSVPSKPMASSKNQTV